MLISFCRFDVVSVGSVVCCGELETGKGTGVRVGKGSGLSIGGGGELLTL